MGALFKHPSVAGIEAAYRAIDPVFLDSPLISHATADAALGCALLAKVETLNPIRSFKGRGPEWFMASQPDGRQPFVTASAGNFGQGLAYAARKRGRGMIIFAATTASPLKVEAMRRLGADVRLAGDDFDAAKAAALELASAEGLAFIVDGAEPTIAEGAGTIALEIERQLARRGQAIDRILVPLGNGALLTGVGTWIKARMPRTSVVGVVAEVAPSMLLSWQRSRVVTTPEAPTIADGIAVRVPVPLALETMRSTVDDVWTVSEASIRAAMLFCHRHYGLVIEPAGAVGVAAAIEHGDRVAGQSIGTILCGGNLTDEQIRTYLA